MKYLLDTDICIYIINEKTQSILNKLKTFSEEEIFISSITTSELYYGLEKSVHYEKNKKALEEFLYPFSKIDYRYEHSNTYGKIRSELEKKGLIIGPYDLMIGAIAKFENMILVTNNRKEFRRIKDLKIETWN